jgi:surface carbohydrate biosynthesis protein (TIGR04326 family)
MSTLTIWASDSPPPDDAGPLVLWQGFLPADAPSDWLSLPQEVDENRESLRSEYLAWLHGVGLSAEGGIPLVDRLVVRPSFSYWWMTIPATYSLEIDAPAYTAVRMMALVRLLSVREFSGIRLVGRNKPLERMLQRLAEMTGATLTLVRVHPVRADGTGAARGSRLSAFRTWLKNSLPPVSAMWVLAKHVQLALRRGSRGNALTRQPGIAVIDYLAHFGPGVDTGGPFSSNYWGELVSLLDGADEPVWWLHISARDGSRKVFATDAALVAQFNDHKGSAIHEMLQIHLTVPLMLRALRDYLRVAWLGMAARSRKAAFGLPASGLSLWPVFQSSFRDQLFGGDAMRNCLWLNLLETVLAKQPKQRLGLYLFENQPWEMAFVHAWRSAGHGELIGVSHSTMLFWDTRYFKDPSDLWALNAKNPMPWPDKVAVNGPFMKAACVSGGYPSARLVVVEALRYPQAGLANRKNRPSDAARILILDEYSAEISKRMIKRTVTALRHLPFDVSLSIRPHPANINASKGLDLGIAVDEHLHIGDAIDAADFVVCGAFSSAAIEAVVEGAVVVVVADGQAFSASPAEGLPGCSVAHRPEAIAEALSRTYTETWVRGSSPAPVFMIDDHLARWRSVLWET